MGSSLCSCVCPKDSGVPKDHADNELSQKYDATQEGTQHSSGTSNSAKLEKLMAANDKLETENKRLKAEKEFADVRFYREDVVFDPETAHPRLKVSKDGKCVEDTGNTSYVSKSEKRFDSHICLLAKDGFSKGKHYWEVEVGLKKNWVLGVACETVDRTGILTLSPQNGYWVIKLESGKDYLAWESRLNVKGNEKPTKIGIFLNVSDKSLSFYDVHRKMQLYTFTDVSSAMLYPFFSTGLEKDNLPLKLPFYFEEA